MTIARFWLNLGWLVMLVVTVAVPLALDTVDRLTYFTSLVLWGLPILYLWPVFNMITADGTGGGGVPCAGPPGRSCCLASCSTSCSGT